MFLIGPDEKKFRIHRDLFLANSSFIETQTTTKNFDFANSTVRLPDYNVDTFQYFVHWLYNKTLASYHNHGLTEESLRQLEMTSSSAYWTWMREPSAENHHRAKIACEIEGKALVLSSPLSQLVGLYILAGQLQVSGLKDQIYTRITRIYGETTKSRTYYWKNPLGTMAGDKVIAINLAYHNLEDCSLKRLLVRMYVENVDKEQDPTGNKYHPKFYVDVIDELRRRLNASTLGV